MIAWAFPGQGSQRPHMGAGLPRFAELAEHARRAIGLDLAARCLTDPDPSWDADELQQAIFVTSCAAAGAARPLLPRPEAVVGHSLGDYAALVEAEVLDYDTALRLVDARGRAMAAAGTQRPGAMAAVLGLGPEIVTEACEQIGEVWPANVNGAAQTVVSGTVEGVEAAGRRLRAAGARGVMRLPISIACHTPLMAPAAERVAELLASIEMRAPSIAFWSTVDAEPKRDGAAIARALVDGITQPVLFSATAERMHAAGVDAFVEVGPGQVLRGLLRRCVPGASVASAATAAT